MLFDYDDEIH